MSMKEIFLAFAKENDIPCGEITLEPEAPNQYCIIMKGENGNYEGHAMFFEEENLFVFYTLLGVRVPEERRDALCRYLMDLNYQLKYGGFFIDEESGALSVRVTQYMVGADWEKQELMEQLITGCGRTADHYYPQVMKRIFG